MEAIQELLNGVKKLLAKKKLLAFLSIIFLLYYYNSMNVYNDHRPWTEYLTTSCDKTFKGFIKTAFYSDLDFWVHADVSMEMSINNLKQDSQSCNEYWGPESVDPLLRLQCHTRVKEKWDWLNRCMPIVKRSCRNAGGLC